MKKHTLIAAVLIALSTTSVFAQQIITNKGDKISVEDVKAEPWRETGGAVKASSNTQNIYQNANVGIGDFSAEAVSDKLKVKGESTVQKAFVTGMINVNNTAAADFVPVGINLSSGELVKITNTNNVKPFSYVTFNINTKSGEDWVKAFDTKIPSSQYTVLLMNAIFYDGKLALRNYAGGSVYGTKPFNYRAIVGPNGTWILNADYPFTGPKAGATYRWKMICLVIQNTQIQELNTVNVSLDANNSGAAAAKPAGL